ncbi:MAG: L-2-amino-thiazoline-4-carboxylic acid hydrolase [Paracoccaceae bacterium]
MATEFPDRITQTIGALVRRETEARILAPLIGALGDEFGREKVVAILRRVIENLARQQGRELAAEFGSGPDAFLETLQFWTRGGALEIDLRVQTGTTLDFDVTRCRYAEMYRALGLADLGAVLSCNRDSALIEGFDPNAALRRDQTIMEGARTCTFRYTFTRDAQTP